MPASVNGGYLPGFLITRVGDLDDVQRVIEIRRGVFPLRGIQGKDRADRHVRNRGDVRIPGIKTVRATR